MFLVALHIITKQWYDPNDLRWLNGQINCGTTYTENITYGTNEETTDMGTTWLNLQRIIVNREESSLNIFAHCKIPFIWYSRMYSDMTL